MKNRNRKPDLTAYGIKMAARLAKELIEKGLSEADSLGINLTDKGLEFHLSESACVNLAQIRETVTDVADAVYPFFTLAHVWTCDPWVDGNYEYGAEDDAEYDMYRVVITVGVKE